MKKFKKYYKLLPQNKFLLIVFAIFLFDLFLRTYQLDLKHPFGYDQVDNAWAAKNLIEEGQFPLVGMVAKTNSGIFIGPLYYYFISFFYWIFNLNPIASQVVGVLSNIFTFTAILYVTKKLFSKEVAVIALLLNTFNFHVMIFDTVQWPVQLLPGVALIIFYFLYKVITGDVKKLIFLAIVVGIAFNLHFTAIFFPIIILLCLPLFPRNKETLKYSLVSLSLFVIFLIPNIIYSFTNKSSNAVIGSYLSTYYHGFHLTRMLQILGDALIQFDPYLIQEKLKQIKVVIIPLFLVSYLFKSFTNERKKLAYLVFLFYMVPWLVFTTYSGEISDYYFIINRFVGLFIISFLIYLFWEVKYKIAKVLVIIFLIAYSINGIKQFLPYKDTGNLYKRSEVAKQAVDQGRRIEFQVGVPESYLYYYFMREKGVDVYGSHK